MRHHDPHHTFVPASSATVAGRLPDHLDVGGTRLRFTARRPADPDRGPWRTPVTWQRGRHRGTGHLEVRPAGWGWSELELRWDAGGPPRPTRTWTRRPVAGPTPVHALERRLGGRPVPPAAPSSPSSRRPRTRRNVLVAASTAVALVAGLAVVGPFGGATPVTSDDAVARFRAAAEAHAVDAVASGDPVHGDQPEAATTTTTSEAVPSDPDDPEAPAGADGSAPEPTDTHPSSSEPVPDAASSTREATTGAPAPGGATDRDAGNEAVAGRGASGSEAADRPAEGVYRYATDGWEELDARGSHRRFPDETVQTVHHTDAGFRQVWEPIEERRDEHTLAVATDPPTLVTTDTSRSFFGQQRQQRFTCTPTRTDRAGWTVRCDDEAGTTMTVTTVTEGTERRTVAGEEVEVVRARVTADLSGETEGRRTSTVWTRASDGLLVRTEVEADLEAPGPFGRVRYREAYTLHLAALEPQR